MLNVGYTPNNLELTAEIMRLVEAINLAKDPLWLYCQVQR